MVRTVVEAGCWRVGASEGEQSPGDEGAGAEEPESMVAVAAAGAGPAVQLSGGSEKRAGVMSSSGAARGATESDGQVARGGGRPVTSRPITESCTIPYSAAVTCCKLVSGVVAPLKVNETVRGSSMISLPSLR